MRKTVLDKLLSLRLLKPFFDNILLEHAGLPNVLPLALQLDSRDSPVLGLLWDLDFRLGLVYLTRSATTF